MSKFIAIISYGGLIFDANHYSTKEEAINFLHEVCNQSFNYESDDARVFEMLDDNRCKEVYSYTARSDFS